MEIFITLSKQNKTKIRNFIWTVWTT